MADQSCSGCAAVIPESSLICPSCYRLVHASRLEELAKRATELEASNAVEALLAWREALALLPPDSKQADVIRTRVSELSASQRLGDAPQNPPSWTKRLGPFAAAGAVLWKFKTVVLLALTKAKFLLLGLGKMNTLFSMLASMGLYWTLYGWRFAAGFIIGIYIHEMGHVWSLRHYGLRASAPMFIPGFGAVVSLYDSPANVYEDARIGLAGPTWGAAAAVGFAAVGVFTSDGLWFALARATATINLFNLIPVWQLDGGRGLRALSFPQRLSLGGLFVILWMLTGEAFFALLTLGAAYRLFWAKDHADPGDPQVLIEFGGLAAVFGAIIVLIPLDLVRGS